MKALTGENDALRRTHREKSLHDEELKARPASESFRAPRPSRGRDEGA